MGMRPGFDGIAGDVSLIASAISGSMLVDCGTVAPGQKLDLTGVRQTGSTRHQHTHRRLTLSQIGITAGDVTGEPRHVDFGAGQTGDLQSPRGRDRKHPLPRKLASGSTGVTA